MSLRTRLTLAAGAAVFVALLVASLVVYFSVRAKLHDQIDVSLIDEAQNISTKTGNAVGKLGTAPFLEPEGGSYFQLVPNVAAVFKHAHEPLPVALPTITGKTGGVEPPQKVPLADTVGNPDAFVPLTQLDGLVALGIAPPYFRDVRYRGTPMRLYTLRLGTTGDGLVRAARPLSEANATISRVRWLLVALTLGGALAAALLGRLAASTVLRPVRMLAATVRDVTATRDLEQQISADGGDELSSLARDFNAMLAALAESQRAQQQLIADASHELRTPLTAHRTNIELLARPDLPPDRRPLVLKAAVRGIDELSTLISDLIQAARNGRSVDARAPVRLDELADAAVERARRRAPQLTFETALEPSVVAGSRTRLERAIDNVLDNAIKWSAPGSSVEVGVREGVLTVRDHGPGVDDADLPHVFDRFYRAAAARGMPGSGLGLAIVKQAVDDHGGLVEIANADGGGAVVTLRLAALTNF